MPYKSACPLVPPALLIWRARLSYVSLVAGQAVIHVYKYLCFGFCVFDTIQCVEGVTGEIFVEYVV